MNLIISIIVFIGFINHGMCNLISIYHSPKERREAIWVKSIFIKNGIPADYVELAINYTNCTTAQFEKQALMQLCLNDKKELKTLKFDRKKFFWQLSPLIEIN